MSAALSTTTTRPPVGTALVILVNVVAAVWEFAWVPEGELGWYTMCPVLVVERGQWHRIITHAFLHTGLMHLGVNMLSTGAIGAALEARHFGTARFLAWILYATPLCGSTHVALAYGLSYAGYPSLKAQHSLGFSGVLFALAVGEAWRSDATSRSLFGIVSVPNKLYPVAMLLAMQIVLPNVSFLGHLAGLLVGAAETLGLFRFFFFPSKTFVADNLDVRLLRAAEHRAASCPLGGGLSYVPVPPATNDDHVLGDLRHGLSAALVYARHFLSFLVDFFGIRACGAALVGTCSRQRCPPSWWPGRRRHTNGSSVSYHRVAAAAPDEEHGGGCCSKDGGADHKGGEPGPSTKKKVPPTGGGDGGDGSFETIKQTIDV
mmetsp:Transcript_28675/g.92309  ORF Transcript_28675/g.92309 Transcript_28675/m.92309 type:complete len:375 (+) Transcript_28675:71-1195(+)